MVSSNRLMPGEKGSITVKVDTSRRAGFIFKTVKVSSNDPARPNVTLTLKAEIKNTSALRLSNTPQP